MLHILMKISLKFVAEGPNDNNPALVQIMALHQIGDKPLSEPMLTQFTDTYAALGEVELTRCGQVTPYGIRDLGQH